MNDQIENYELDMNNIPAHIASALPGHAGHGLVVFQLCGLSVVCGLCRASILAGLALMQGYASPLR